MKKFILFLAIIPILLFGQNFEPSQKKFIVPAITLDSIYLSSDTAYFQQTRFIKGNHWEAHPVLGRIAGYNQLDVRDGIKLDSPSVLDNTLLFVKMEHYKKYWTHCQENDVLNARGIEYSPILEINPSISYTLQTVPTSSRNPIFGFQTIVGTKDYTNDCLVVDSFVDSNTVILDEPWTADQLSYFGIDNEDIENNYLCKGMYITINLRRDDFSEDMTDDAVLKIEIPHTYFVNDDSTTYGGNLYIDSIPRTLDFDTNYVELPYSRGKVMKLDSVPRPTEFYIRKNMLPSEKENITLSGFLFLDNIRRPENSNKENKYLTHKANGIDKLKLKVTYLGGTPLAINWVRFETPATKHLLAGYEDSLLILSAQYVLDKFATDSLEQHGIKLFRFNTHIEAGVQQWIGERYVRKLLGDVISGETWPVYSHLYEKYVGTADRWMGINRSMTTVSVPFFDCHNDKTKIFDYKANYWPTLNFYNGYIGFDTVFNFVNSFNSKYEIELRTGASPDFTKNMDEATYWTKDYCRFTSGKFSPLAYWEDHIYINFRDSTANGYLYSDKNWYHQIFTLTSAVQDATSGYNAMKYSFRGLTGEEFRLFDFNGILMGCKGVIIDGLEEHEDTPEYTSKSIRLISGIEKAQEIYGSDAILLNTDPWIVLKDTTLGADYLRRFTEYKPFFREGPINYNIISDSLNVPMENIYYGHISIRTEMRKLHEWIDFNESTLMSLNLQAWYGAGYKIWYNQHPKYGTNDTLLKKYIDLQNIKTSRLISYNPSTYEIINTGWEEDRDSSFFDLTLLATNDDTTMTKTLIVGIQNRRCDPLVYIPESDTSGHMTNKMIRFNTGFTFIPTAEFDDVVRGSDSTFWKEKWWQRLGAREIKIPLIDSRRIQGPYSLAYAVKVTELRDTNWYSQEPYNDLIDTIINFSKPTKDLIVKLLPGNGKLLQFTYYYPELCDPVYAGYSSYDLQCDVVEARYHKVYLKEDTTTPAKHSVYYRRSEAFDKSNPPEIINWEPEQLVSKYYDFVDSDSNVVCTQGYNTLWCGPPQLVVRYDSTRAKDMVYIAWNGVCKYSSDSTKGYIFESIFSANDTTQIIPETVNKIYDYFTDQYPSGNEFEIGTVSLNASMSGNYYAWSDARDGLCYAWKAPQDTFFVQTGSIPMLMFPLSSFNCFLHPELNRYSRIDEDEDEAAIVFEGKTSKTTDSASMEVFYTRLRKTDSGLQTYISTMPKPGVATSPITTDLSNSVIWQSANMGQTAIHKLPKVHRNIAEYEMPNSIDSTLETLQLKMDRVYWEAEDVTNNYNNIILTNGYDLIDTLVQSKWEPKYYIGQMPSVIMNSNGPVADVTFTQGVMKDQIVNYDTLKTYYNDSAMVLSFTADGNRIFNLPHNFWTFMNPIGIDITSSSNLNEFVNTGTEPTLPAIPSVKDDSLYLFMRTFYLDDSLNTMASRENFFKIQTFSKKYHQFFGIANKDKKARWFTPIVLTNEQGQLESPKVYTHKHDGMRLVPRDTIITDWFEVKDIKSLDYIEKGNLTEDYSIKIQRQRDSKIYSLQNASQTDNKYRIKTKMLLNGKDEKYRLLWIINKTNAQFIEQIVIGDISQRAELDGILEERELGKLGDVQAEEFIDLNEETYANTTNILGLSVYPNPANDELYIVCYLPRTLVQDLKSDLILKLFDNLGREVFTKEIKAGQIIRIPTANLQTGSYYVKVFQNNQTLLPAEVKNLIIER